MSRYDIGAREDAILPNKLDLTDADAINQEEFVGFTNAEQKAIDELNEETLFTLEYLYDLHSEALGHLYEFAGRLRTVNMSKDGFSFPAAQFLKENMDQFAEECLDPINENVWNEKAELSDHLAAMHAELLYLHPFREGNGRVVRLFTKLIYLAKTGKELDFEMINRGDNFQRYIAAVQEAAADRHDLMQQLFRELQT